MKRDFETHEVLLLAFVLDTDNGLPVHFTDSKRPVLHIFLDLGIRQLAPQQPLRVKHRISRVRMERVLRRFTNPIIVTGKLASHVHLKGHYTEEKLDLRTTTYNRSSSPKLTQEGVILFP